MPSVSGPVVVDRPAIGHRLRAARYLVATLVVAVYWLLGFLLHLDLAEYQLIGIPLLVIFQLLVQRQPLRTLWVRSGPPIRFDRRFLVVWAIFALVPAYETAVQLGHLSFASAGLYATGVVGAFGLSYALQNMRAATLGQVGLCLITAGAIALAPELLVLLAHARLHVHAPPQAGSANLHGSWQSAVTTLLWGLPAGFMIEEVFFRGALDTYLHRGETGTGWLSAIFVSALWGLWHLPGSALFAPHLLSAVLQLLVAQIFVGVPLSLWWRKSGNLAVNNTTHAVIDAVRALL